MPYSFLHSWSTRTDLVVIFIVAGFAGKLFILHGHHSHVQRLLLCINKLML